MIVIHGHPASTYTRTLRMACLELARPHRVEVPPFGKPAHATLHPFLKMPAVTDGEVTLFETLAGLTWLDAGTGRLLPQDLSTRARTLGWCSALVDYVYGPVVGLGHHVDDPGDALAPALEVLRTVDDAWTLGDGVNAASLMLYPMLAYASRVEAFADARASTKHVKVVFDALDARESARGTAA